MKQNYTVLIIDDEEVMRDSCEQALRSEGYNIHTSPDGKSGLSMVEETAPDIVLLDLMMPEMNGMEVLDHIKKIDPDIISLVITGYGTVESAVEAMKGGAFDFIPKPFTPRELRDLVKRAIDKREVILKTRRLQREKEAFISIVSHQLREPLAVAMQNFQVLLGGFAGEITPRQREILERTEHRLEGLRILVQEWLNMARIEKECMISNIDRIDVAEVIQEAIETSQLRIEEKHLKVEKKIQPNLPFFVGNRTGIKEMLTNLINNAAKYNKNRGEIRITADKNKGNFVIKISDDGIGIHEEDLPFIFDDFFRAGGDAEKRQEGFGLGLAVVKKIVDAQGGYIRAESRVGEGTTFTVKLPLPED